MGPRLSHNITLLLRTIVLNDMVNAGVFSCLVASEAVLEFHLEPDISQNLSCG